MQWRLTLDVPYSFASIPGTILSFPCGDFRPGPNALADTWRDPITNLVMLKPSFLDPKQAGSGWLDFTNFRAGAGWKGIQRTGQGSGRIPLMTSTSYAGEPNNFALIEVLVALAITALLAALVTPGIDDYEGWALETGVMLGQDQGWALTYQTIHDEAATYNCWITVQWDVVQIAISSDGTVRVFQHLDRTDLNNANKLRQIDEFQIASRDQMNQRYGFFMFLPVPGYGILMHHGSYASGGLVNMGSTRQEYVRGHLIRFPSYQDPGGTWHVTEASPIRYALNRRLKYVKGTTFLTFPTSGTYLGEIWDPGFKPTFAPYRQVVMLPTLQQGVATALRKADNSDAYDASVDRQGRTLLTLSTTDTKYTPFLYGYALGYLPVFSDRDTTPLPLETHTRATAGGKIDKLLRLEWMDDEYGRFEGKAAALMETDLARQIAERGDATFLLEYSADGNTWTTLAGGFAKEFHPELVITHDGLHYVVTFALYDLWERFREVHLIKLLAFDGLDAGTNFDNILICSGFEQVASIPSEVSARKIPPVRPGFDWAFAPREGDTADEMVRALLLMMREQNLEWRVRYDWTAQGWLWEKKPRDTANFWTLQPYSDMENAAARIWSFGDGGYLKPESPEGNIVEVLGFASTDTSPLAARITSGPLTNMPSLTDPSSPDYLGRIKTVQFRAAPLYEQGEVNKMARRIFDAVVHRRDTGSLPVHNLNLSLAPNVMVKLKDENLNQIGEDLWIKRRHVIVEQDEKEEMNLEVDSVWEGRVK